MLAAMVRTGTRSRVRGGERDMRWAYPGRRTSTLLPCTDGYRSGCRVPLCHATHADAASVGTAVNDARMSVVVITRNRREQLVRTLSRLAELPERPPVILVDNASDDGTAGLVKGLFPHVRVVALRRTRGRWHAPSGSVRPRRRTSPSATTTPGGRPGRCRGQPTTSTQRLGWACSRRGSSSSPADVDPVCGRWPPARWSRWPTCPARRCSASSPAGPSSAVARSCRSAASTR